MAGKKQYKWWEMKTEITDESQLQPSATQNSSWVGISSISDSTIFHSHIVVMAYYSIHFQTPLDHSSSEPFSLFWCAFQPSCPLVIEICLIFCVKVDLLKDFFLSSWCFEDGAHLHRRDSFLQFLMEMSWVCSWWSLSSNRCIHFNVFVASCWFLVFGLCITLVSIALHTQLSK